MLTPIGMLLVFLLAMPVVIGIGKLLACPVLAALSWGWMIAPLVIFVLLVLFFGWVFSQFDVD